jgi:N-acetyl-S-(2-succino)cysteine monooxygenase
MQARKMCLATFLTAGDVHVAAWRHPRFRFNNGADFEMYRSAARVAEAAMFDLALLGDVPARSTDPADLLSHLSKYDVLEPLTVITALAMVTKHIGYAATASTTYNQPYHIARRFASIDHVSAGRAAWNVVTTANPTEAYNFGIHEHPPADERYARAEEFVDVVFGLWNSWRQGAFVRDKVGGRYFQPDDFRPLNHHGKNFDVRGPLDVARTPQGRPIIVQAGSSGPGQAFAARVADVVFTSQQSLAGAQAFSRGVKEQAVRFGRSPQDLIIVCGVMPYVAETREAAQAKFDELQALIDPDVARSRLEDLLGDLDMSRFDFHAPIPESLTLLQQTGFSSRAEGVLGFGRRAGMTLGQLAAWLAGTRGHLPLIGTGKDIADWMEEWFTGGGSDGFLVFPYALPEGLEDFARFVLPELQQRGLVKTEHTASTLREALGLATPT